MAQALKFVCRDGELCHPSPVFGSVHRRAGGHTFHAMTFARKLIQDIKAGQLGALHLG